MEKNRLYSIGKISDLMGISVQTLRFYEKIGLFKPCYINPQTGYRYYEYSQMHKIDRIQYFQKLGISLKDIKNIFNSSNTDEILENLIQQRDKELQNLEDSKKKLNELDWYIDYFSYLKEKKHFGIAYMKHIEKRYAMVVEMGEGAPFCETNEALYRLKHQVFFQNLNYKRQYVSLLDDKALRKGKSITLQYGLYLWEDPGVKDIHIVELPEGQYICFLAPIYNEDKWDPSIFENFLEKDKSYLVVANEYEDNLYRYDKCMYEIQIIEK